MYQCNEYDVYGSKTSRLAIDPISGGIRTRRLPYNTKCLTRVSLAIVGGSVTRSARSAGVSSTSGRNTWRLLYYLRTQVNRYFEQRLVSGALKTLRQQLENPHTSRDHKVRIRKKLEALESTVANRELSRVGRFGVPQVYVVRAESSSSPRGEASEGV